jgi:hypothetical protein
MYGVYLTTVRLREPTAVESRHDAGGEPSCGYRPGWLKAGGGATHLLVFAGRPLRETVVFGGRFVMNTQGQIEEASADFRAGRF